MNSDPEGKRKEKKAKKGIEKRGKKKSKEDQVVFFYLLSFIFALFPAFIQ
ncbi:MAG: hypothetical protein RRB22_05285 [Gammaproteobacteria bacterium]|nr:hypothetical protein [Gammaproteobacteria bacterium]